MLSYSQLEKANMSHLHIVIYCYDITWCSLLFSSLTQSSHIFRHERKWMAAYLSLSVLRATIWLVFYFILQR